MTNSQQSNYLQKVYSSKKKPLTSYPQKLVKMLVSNYLSGKNCKLVDIGCGRGELAKSFSIFFDVTAIDNNPYDHDETYTYKQMDISQRLDFPDETFDIVFSKSVVEHFPNPRELFLEMKRILKPGGKLVCITPDWEGQYRNFYNDCTHVRPFSKQSLEDILLMSDVENIYVTKFYQLPFTWKSSLLKILPKIINVITPYAIYRRTKITRFSRETMLIGIATKPLL